MLGAPSATHGIKVVLNIIRIIAAAAVLIGWSQIAPVLSAAEPPARAGEAAPAPETSCPLRAWPYIG
ncbi:hypothetical protein [Methylobacterium oryzisoli]|uniref:hypothetical protein n=1 Tax=Methylobacterium oryzisoli TaxID=3385502 RepID=UPI0038920EBA